MDASTRDRDRPAAQPRRTHLFKAVGFFAACLHLSCRTDDRHRTETASAVRDQQEATSLNRAELQQQLGFTLPESARIVWLERQQGVDAMVRVKLEMNRSAFDSMAPSIPVIDQELRAGARRLGRDTGEWNPPSTPGIRATQIAFSVAYSPKQLQGSGFSDRLDIELGYWDIRLDKAITALNAQIQLDRCVLGGDDSLCSGIQRTGLGAINTFRNALQNIGGIETRGLDLTIGFQTKRLPFGRLRALWLTSYMLDYWEKIPTADGVQKIKLEGRVSGTPERAFPKLKSNLVLEWLYDQIGISLSTRYIHSVTEECRDLEGINNTCSNPNPAKDALSENKLAPVVYNDLRIVWLPKFDERLSITAGVNNIFNVDPPACYSCALNGFNPATYDIPGVFGYLRAGYQIQ
jgi:hypothetical protein